MTDQQLILSSSHSVMRKCSEDTNTRIIEHEHAINIRSPSRDQIVDTLCSLLNQVNTAQYIDFVSININVLTSEDEERDGDDDDEGDD